MGAEINYADIGIWVGWNAEEVPGGSCGDVVAIKSCSGFSVQVC